LVSALYPIPWAWLAPLIGFIWLAGRIAICAPIWQIRRKRLIGAGLGGLTNLIMFMIAAAGVARAC